MRSRLCSKRNQCPVQVMGMNYVICLGKYDTSSVYIIHLKSRNPSYNYIWEFIFKI